MGLTELINQIFNFKRVIVDNSDGSGVSTQNNEEVFCVIQDRLEKEGNYTLAFTKFFVNGRFKQSFRTYIGSHGSENYVYLTIFV